MKKPFIRRASPDGSQTLRRAVQLGFVALNLWIGIEFYWFVRQFETGAAVTHGRPPGVEGWLPIAGLLNLKYTLVTGEIPVIHPAAMVLLVAFLAMSWLLRRSFCSWLCPVGTLSEELWKFGRRTFRRNWRFPRWLDIPLRSLKYLVFGFFFYAVLSMPADAIAEFQRSPFGVLADVKMLNFFRDLGVTAAVVLAVLMIGSIFVQNLWCRYLCPYGALIGLVSWMSPTRIRRSEQACIDCAKCAKACPSHLAVDKLISVASVECTGCLECVSACPVEGALEFQAPRSRRLSPKWVAAGVAVIFVGCVAAARLTGHWASPIPPEVYSHWIPLAASLSH